MKDERILEVLKDEHVDLMIRLAFELEAYQTVKQLECDGEKSFTKEEERITEQALFAAYEKLRQQELRESRNQRMERHRHRLMRVIEILACAVLVVGISAPVALANFETLRQRLVEFLISFDSINEQTVVFPFGEVAVPDEWEGEYFPTYLPEGTGVTETSAAGRARICFSTIDGAMIVFVENNDDCSINTGAENEIVTMTNVNGYEARVSEFFENEHIIRIMWNNDERWFVLETVNVDFDTAQTIAESVRKIRN